MATVHWQYEWRWLVGFVEPLTGETSWWSVPRLNAEVFSRLLADFAEHCPLGSPKQVVLVVDQAAFHTSKQVRIPEGVHLMLLSPTAPQLQPVERLWPLTNEAMANQSFDTLEEREAVTAHRCRVLMRQRDRIRGLTNFYGWSDAAT